MYVAIVLRVQPEDSAEAFIWIFPVTRTELNDKSVVSPISVVDTSVQVAVLPFQTVMNSPALALTPLWRVYLQNAAVNDPVGCVYKLFSPTIVEPTVEQSVKVPPIAKVVVTVKFDPLSACTALVEFVAYEALATDPSRYDAVKAFVANEEDVLVSLYDEDIEQSLFVEYELLMELLLQEDVPIKFPRNDPVTPCVTVSDPVT